MKKTKPSNLTADWGVISPRAPWQHVSSMELSKVLGVHLQTICNWRMRSHLPAQAEKSKTLRGNKCFYRIAAIRSWLEARSEADIVREWVKQDVDSETITDAQINWLLATVYKAPEASIQSNRSCICSGSASVAEAAAEVTTEAVSASGNAPKLLNE